MSIERGLQLLMALLTALGTLMLGMGERNALLPLLAAAVSLSSVYLTDIKGWVRLNTNVANLAGLAAIVGSLWDYRQLDRDRQLLALANLLIYLQCALLFRQKTPRIYWMLSLLSLLQVAVATVLNLSMWFGLLLVLYLFLSLSALSLFLIHREQRRYDPAAMGSTAPQPSVAASPPMPPTVKAAHGALAASRWPWMATEPVLVPRLVAAASTRSAWTRDLVQLVLRMGLYTLAFTAVLFLAVPRTPSAAWGDVLESPQHSVGFTESVTLGELGEIVENPEEVLRFQLTYHDTGEPYTLLEQPMLRGVALMHYAQGEWRQANRPVYRYRHRPPPAAPQQSNLVQFDAHAGALDTDTLFGFPPIYSDDETSADLLYDAQLGRLLRSRRLHRHHIDYTLLTNGLADGRQLPLTPAQRPTDVSDLEDLLSLPDPQTDHTDLSRLRDKAEQLVQGLPAHDILSRAQALEYYLRDSGEFKYTLIPPDRTGSLDPIENFLFEQRAGHCEYFASALTLMLRSIDIPARMIVGFKGADWNSLSGSYQVRQLHAHAWVEVYLTPQQIPLWIKTNSHLYSKLGQQFDWQQGGWLKFDPTPGIEGANLMPPPGMFPSMRQFVDYAESLWSGYVLAMDSRRQQEAVYGPLKTSSQQLVEALFDRETWSQTIRGMLKILSGQRPDDTGPWFSWQASLVTMGLLLLVAGLIQLARPRIQRLLAFMRPSSPQPQAVGPDPADFYRRLEQLLSRYNLIRLHCQTQREFAQRAGDRLAAEPGTLGVAALPRRVVEMFYRVRFGGRALDNREAEAVEHALCELSAALSSDQAS